MKNFYFLIIGGANAKENLLKTEKKKKLKTIVVDKNPNCYLSKKADIFIKSDFSKNNQSLKKIKKINKNIIGVATLASDAGVNLVADVNEHYKLNGVTVAQANIINKKIEFRKFQQKYNLPGKIKILKNNSKSLAIKKKKLKARAPRV